MKTIRFVPRLENRDLMLLEPIPCKKNIPQWYKDGETTYFLDGKENPGLKTCKPFLDSMISGYYLLIPFDIDISYDDDNNIKFEWDGPEQWAGFVNERKGDIGKTIPKPEGFKHNHLIWSSMWGWKTPRGWSSLLTHPVNRLELPFYTVSGIIDSDKFFAGGNIPFFIKDGFVGTIEKGTPFAQVIPIKRSRWSSFSDYGLVSPAEIKGDNLHNHNQSYKKLDWVKKEYN